MATATQKFDIGDRNFEKYFVLMKNLTEPIICLHFRRHNSVVIDTTYGFFNFPQLTMQVKIAASQTGVKPQVVFVDNALTVQPMTTKTITAFVNPPSEWNTTCTVTPKNHGSSESTDITFNVNNIRQECSSQSG